MLEKPRARCQSLGRAGVFLLSASLAAGCGDGNADAKAEALSLSDVAAYWGVRGQDSEGNNYIRPVVRFRVVNEAPEEVGYVQAMGVFRRESFPDEPWGSDFLYSVSEEPIPPGGSSGVITLRSDASFIGKDAPERMFDNPQWEDVAIEVFLRVGASGWRSAVEMVVPKQIGAPGLDKFLEPDDEAPLFPEPEPGQTPPPLPR